MAQSGSTVTLKTRKTNKTNGKLHQYEKQINFKLTLHITVFFT
jgi:small nuclear ribonucleoprotein (snRNP)-like protein